VLDARPSAESAPFVDAVRRSATPAGQRVRLIELHPNQSLRQIYSVRREVLVRRGADVRGLDALLEFIDDATDTAIDAFALNATDANLIGFLARDSRRLAGWCVVPSDLLRLPS